MYDNLLNTTYTKIKKLDLSFPVEHPEVIKLVHDYRMYWKPQKVNTLLLAESHVYTDLEMTRYKHDFNEIPGYPCKYVRFVYCLSYGENHRLDKKVDSRKGTPQFWKLFNEAVEGDFKVTSNNNKADKIEHKISLLKKMKYNDGVWLLDASIIGVYNNGIKPSFNDYNKIIQCSIDNYCVPIINDINPKCIIVIGKTVYDRLYPIINKFSPKPEWINQPNARLKSKNKKTLANILK